MLSNIKNFNLKWKKNFFNKIGREFIWLYDTYNEENCYHIYRIIGAKNNQITVQSIKSYPSTYVQSGSIHCVSKQELVRESTSSYEITSFDQRLINYVLTRSL